jgi:RNA polymerase primary sigma factor
MRAASPAHGRRARPVELHVRSFERPWHDALAAAEPLTPAQERVVRARIAAGDNSARDELVSAHLRYVFSRAARFMPHPAQEDVIAEGMYGLVRASRLFDPRRGAAFTPYATPFIDNAMLVFVFCERAAVRISKHAAKRFKLVHRGVERVGRESPGGHVTAQRVAQVTGLPVHDVEAVLGAAKPSVGAHRSSHVRRLPAEDPVLESRLRAWDVTVMLNHLKPTGARVLHLHFGLDRGYERELEETAQAAGMKKSNVWYHKTTSIERLRELDMQFGGRWGYRPGGR